MIEQTRTAPVVRELTVSDLGAALSAGWADFRSQPAFGLFFAAIYVLSGLFLYYALLVRGEAIWLVPAAAGFPIVAPFTAVGLYEVSRRREAGLPMSWRASIGALRGHGDDQPLMMGGMLFIAFSFWIGIAHGIFAIFISGSAGATSLELFQTTPGLLMLAVGGTAGALLALALYAVTVISLPLLVDREVDFLTAIMASLNTIRSNPQTLLVWAAVIAIALFAAMIPLFLGLLIVLPVLGHATWHLYRRAVA